MTPLCLLLVCTFHTVHASWWYLGLASSYQTIPVEVKQNGKQRRCSSLNFLLPRQRDLCNTEDKLLEVITKGAAIGISECQHQFRSRRWNCTTFNITNVFGEVLNIKSRETAYLYAIFSAGIMYSVSRGCSKGQLNHCGCGQKLIENDNPDDFEWGGCSDNLLYGSKFSRDFVDSVERREIGMGLMNLWNNGAGRKAIKANIKKVCKCHGVSGSCSVRICWRSMDSFRSTGSYLFKRYDSASQMKFSRKKRKLKPLRRLLKKPSKKDLVYLKQSPDFCLTNTTYGSLGTRNRRCKRESDGLDGCVLMCCGRGFVTIPKVVTEDCHCKFYWCCFVLCKKCTQRLDMHYCN
ncbi:protein Wnt-5b [Octopus bimaculoides]|uniref:protein Wnt-5b n=1 Tax=Octopus bimaculoides TaxID=37653 RepID=UPI0022E41887|nr:protein Wnt-5b [Octopus bimaculoides]